MNTLNKAQKAHDEKTAWAPRIWLAVGIVALIIALLFELAKQPTVAMNVDGQRFNLLLATTPAQLEKGLGYRSSLPRNEGMLFEFQTASVQCFWMKGMEFPLDMIWVNSSKQIVYIQANVSPKTYPHNYCPLEPAQYVIELNAGEVAATQLRLGQTLNF